jgi:Fe-S-cluster-containing hydrogenase component 2
MKRLYIDLEICNQCKDCPVECSYFYHPDNNGIIKLRSLAAFALVCRRCEEAACIKSCPKDALEKQDGGLLKRYSMLCISCKSCSFACPFGTIYPEFLPYVTSQCDWCLNRGVDVPDCVRTCTKEGVEYKEVEEDIEKGIYVIGEHLAVRSFCWQKEPLEKKK